MTRLLPTIVLSILLVGCHIGTSDEEALARARTPHGLEVRLELRQHDASAEDQLVIGELLSVDRSGLLVEIGNPHHLLFIPVSQIKRLGVDEKSPLQPARANRKRVTMRILPEKPSQREKLIDGLATMSRYPQGLSAELEQQLLDELGIERKQISGPQTQGN